MNKIVVIGSNAINYHIKDFRKKPSDIDLILTQDYVHSFISTLKNLKIAKPINGGKKYFIQTDEQRYEIDIIQDSIKQKLYDYIINDENSIIENNYVYPSLDILYSIKNSHKYKKNSPHFLKTMNDIIFLKNFGCNIPDNFQELYKELEKYFYNYSHPKLNQNKKDFFTDSVNYIYDHDDIHQAVKILEKPAYQYFIKDNEEILCDKNKFFNCSENVKINAVLEESYVLALERSIIPFKTEYKRKEIFDHALMKVCTSITSGFFREFAYNNYYNVQKLYNDNFVEKFKTSLEKGEIKKWQK